MLNFMKEFDPTGRNYENLKTIYASMTDDQFLKMAEAVRDGKAYTPFIYDHKTENRLNLKYVENFGRKFLGNTTGRILRCGLWMFPFVV